MTSAAGRRLEELGFAAQFVVWAARQWVRAGSADPYAAKRLQEAFRQVGAPEALVALDRVLGVIASGARRRLDFRNSADVTLGRDEHGLIEVLDALQARPADRRLCACDGRARQIVASWVPPRELRTLQAALAELAVSLGSVGLRVTCVTGQALLAGPQRLH